MWALVSRFSYDTVFRFFLFAYVLLCKWKRRGLSFEKFERKQLTRWPVINGVRALRVQAYTIREEFCGDFRIPESPDKNTVVCGSILL